MHTSTMDAYVNARAQTMDRLYQPVSQEKLWIIENFHANLRGSKVSGGFGLQTVPESAMSHALWLATVRMPQILPV